MPAFAARHREKEGEERGEGGSEFGGVITLEAEKLQILIMLAWIYI